MRFQQWELFDDYEVNLACQSIKTLAGSGQVVSMIQERHLMKLIAIYDTSDMPFDIRVAVVRSLKSLLTIPFRLRASTLSLRISACARSS